MRISFLSSMFLALMVGISGVAHAAPKAEVPKPTVSAHAEPEAQLVTVNLNTADEATLQRELSGVGAAKARRTASGAWPGPAAKSAAGETAMRRRAAAAT